MVAASLNRSLYSPRVVFAAAYKLSGQWPILVDDHGPDRWMVYLIGLSDAGAEQGLAALLRELTDQVIRERLDRETRDLRTLIVAQAFAEGNLLDPTRDEESADLDPRGTSERR